MIHRKSNLNRLPSITISAILGMGILGLSASAMADTEKKVNNLAKRVKRIENSIATVSKQSGPAGKDADVKETAARAAQLAQPSVSALETRTSAAETILAAVERFVIQTHEHTLPDMWTHLIDLEQWASSVGTYIELQIAPLRSRLGDAEWRIQNDDRRIFAASTPNSVRSFHFDTVSHNYFPGGQLPEHLRPVCTAPNGLSEVISIGAPNGTYVVEVKGIARGIAPRSTYQEPSCNEGTCSGGGNTLHPGTVEFPKLVIETFENDVLGGRVSHLTRLTPYAVGTQYVQSETVTVSNERGIRFHVGCNGNSLPDAIDSIQYYRINIPANF